MVPENGANVPYAPVFQREPIIGNLPIVGLTAVETSMPPSTPFYADWIFWSFVVSAVAVVLSQLPPIHILLRKMKLTVEPYDYFHITHKVGNPNAQLQLNLSNSGGGRIRIKSIKLHCRRGTQAPFTLSAKTYLQNPSDTAARLFTPFALKPGEEWIHIVNFLNYFSQDEMRHYRQIESNLKNDILAKRQVPENKDTLVEADEVNVRPIIDFYEQKFKWEPGEYEATLTVETEPAKATVTRYYRFIIFESDSNHLKEYADHYKWGTGVYFHNIQQQPGLIVSLTPK